MWSDTSKRDFGAAFETQNIACFTGRRDCIPQLLDDIPDRSDLLGIAFRKFALSEPQIVFETDAHMAAREQALRQHARLARTGA